MANLKPKPSIKKKAKGHRFEKGNKHAVGNSNAGAKRIPVDYEKEANLLLKWAGEEDSNHLAQFTLSRGTYSTKLYEWRDESPVFAEALKVAKDQINLRVREKLNNPDKNYNERLAMRDITAHDVLLKVEERDDKKFESDIKVKAEAATAALTIQQLENKLKLTSKDNANDASK